MDHDLALGVLSKLRGAGFTVLLQVRTGVVV